MGTIGAKKWEISGSLAGGFAGQVAGRVAGRVAGAYAGQNARRALAVYDLLGREVVVLVNAEKMPGTYTATWNAEGMANSERRSG